MINLVHIKYYFLASGFLASVFLSSALAGVAVAPAGTVAVAVVAVLSSSDLPRPIMLAIKKSPFLTRLTPVGNFKLLALNLFPTCNVETSTSINCGIDFSPSQKTSRLLATI